jgi:hypothetical protein
VWSAAGSPEAAHAAASATVVAAPEVDIAELEQADFARLEALGLPGEMAATILTKLDEAIADLPV